MTIEGSDDEMEAMSSLVSSAVEAAIADVLSRYGCMTESFAGMVNYVTPDGQRAFSLFEMDNQYHETTIGLVNWMKSYNDEVQRLNIHEFIASRWPDVDDDDS